MKRLWLSAVVVSCVGCVVGAEVHPTAAEARQPPPEPGAEPSAATTMVSAPPAERAAARATGDGEVWVAGYWHFDGVRYRWVPGHAEARQPRYVRRYASP